MLFTFMLFFRYATVGEALSLPPGNGPECLVGWYPVTVSESSPPCVKGGQGGIGQQEPTVFLKPDAKRYKPSPGFLFAENFFLQPGTANPLPTLPL